MAKQNAKDHPSEATSEEIFANLWVVVRPRPSTGIDEICFLCDSASRFLDLNWEEIAAFVTDEADAKALARRLLKARLRLNEGPDVRFVRSPWPKWFAKQESLRDVFLCDRTSEERIFVEPPKEWKRKWSWNISPDGTGIVMRRTP